MRKDLLFVLIIISFLLAGSVLAVGVKVSEREIKVEARQGELIKKEIIIENPDTNVALFEVFLDNFSDWIKITPESFTLQSNESQKVVLEILSNEKGVFSTLLSVKSGPLSSKRFTANSGVKIPLEIRVDKAEEPVFLAVVSSAINSFSGPGKIVYLFVIVFACFIFAMHFARAKRTLKDYYDSPNIKVT